MKESQLPLQFDVSDLVRKAHRHAKKRVEGITLNLPFVSFSIRPDDVERKIAREVVIYLADRRILNAFECCDSCIEKALESLQDIRSFLVGKQVDLSKYTDGGLYIVFELMLSGIRQFFTFEENLRMVNPEFPGSFHDRIYRRDFQPYFTALEVLRGHLYRCLEQISIVADIEIPKISAHMRYNDCWQVEVYKHTEGLDQLQSTE